MQPMLLASLEMIFRSDKPWWNLIREDFRLIFLLLVFFVSLLVLTVVLYLAGLVVIGRKRVLLADAFIVSLLGTVLSNLFFMFIPYRLVALMLSVFVWLLSIKRLYRIDWLRAIVVGILAVAIYLVIVVILALFFGIIEAVWELLYFSLVFLH